MAVGLEKADDATLWRLLLHFALADTRQRLREQLARALDSAGGKRVKGHAAWRGTEPLLSLLTVPDDQVRDVARNLMRQWVTAPTDACAAHLTPQDIEALAAALGVDVAREWSLTRPYLELHTTAQLLALLDGWKLRRTDFAGLKRSEIIDALMKVNPAGCPAEVAKAGRGKA